MSRRRKIIVVLGCVILAIAAPLLFHRDDEPYYKGRSLSGWVVSYGEETNQAAAIAIREIGANAIPHLLNWIQHEPSTNKQMWLDRINKPIEWVNHKLGARGDWSIKDHDFLRSALAPKAFQLLVPHANLALPELTRLLNSGNPVMVSWNAAESLAYLGEPGVPPLMAALEGTNLQVRYGVLYHAKHLGTNARPLVPLLIQMVEDDAGKHSFAAARALGQLKIEPDRVTPVLVKALSSTNAGISEYSGEALREYGPLARPAIPALTNLLNSDDKWEQRIATFLLHVIDPKQFTNTVEPSSAGVLRRPVK